MAVNPFAPPVVNATVAGIVAPTISKPWLLYAFPWMPYPRRVIIYLREKGISETQVKIVEVREPDQGRSAVGDFSPRPSGSLPILAIPSTSKDTDEHGLIYIRQSIAIMSFLEEICNDFQYGFVKGNGGSFIGKPGAGPLERARISEVMSLAEECTIAWNPVRMLGTDAGSMLVPAAAKEMLRWVRRSLMSIERFVQGRDMSQLREGVLGHVTMADIVLYQFLEFTDDCYGVDMTIGSGNVVKDVYGRDVEENFPQLMAFYQNFKTRASAKRQPGGDEVPPGYARKMSSWAKGVL